MKLTAFRSMLDTLDTIGVDSYLVDNSMGHLKPIMTADDMRHFFRFAKENDLDMEVYVERSAIYSNIAALRPRVRMSGHGEFRVMLGTTSDSLSALTFSEMVRKLQRDDVIDILNKLAPSGWSLTCDIILLKNHKEAMAVYRAYNALTI